MLKKIVFFFFINLLLFFISTAGNEASAKENSINETLESSNYLTNIESLPIVQDIGLIALTIRSAAETYRSTMTKIDATIQYSQNILRSLKETSEKIKNGGYKIKKYIDSKIDYFSANYQIR